MTDIELSSVERFQLLSIRVKLSSTSDLDLTQRWVLELFGEFNPAPFFLSPLRFEGCERTRDSLSLTLSGAHCYGLGFGPEPPVNPLWTRCSIDDSAFGDRLGELIATDRWNFYSLDTARCEGDGSPLTVSDSEVINEILTAHAPHSQAWPGNPEIVHWYGVKGPRGEWVSLAALVRWESGQHILASVVTVTEMRGQGFARTLVRGIGAEMQRQGVKWLGLGVAHDNVSAQRAYERAGFERRANFTTYSLAPSS